MQLPSNTRSNAYATRVTLNGMHVTARLALIATASTLPLAAQTVCTPPALNLAAKSVAAIRHTLHDSAVPEQDPTVPPAIAAQLTQLKDALTRAADAAFACASASAGPDLLQTTLANALHANLTPAAESSAITRNKQDIGAYGSDLSVEIFQLTNTPKFFEVDFRYGIECGDDNLLLIYEAVPGNTHPGWQQRLRWDAPTYKTVADALGDFVMLTPLTGDFRHPDWRFIIAHGQPGCSPAPRPTQFDLDLLAPSTDPAKPTLAWHFEHPYTQTQATLPRLATTDDGIDFRIQSGDPDPTSAHRSSKTSTPTGEEVYRFRLTGNGLVEPLPPGAPEEAPAGTQPTSPTTSSPR